MRHEEALVHYKQSLEILLASNDQWQLIKVYELMGSSYTDLGQFDFALTAFKQCLEINQSLAGHTANQLRLHHSSIGAIYLLKEDYKSAINHFYQHILLSQDKSAEELKMISGSLQYIAYSLNKTDYFDQARSLWLK